MPGRVLHSMEIIRRRVPKRKLTIVDVGHGCNLEPLKAIDELIPGEKSLIAIDRDPEAAHVARMPSLDRLPSSTKFARKVNFLAGDAKQLPLDENSVDILLNNNVWSQYFAYPQFAGTREQARELKELVNSQVSDEELLKKSKGLYKRSLDVIESHLKEVHRVLSNEGQYVVSDPYVPEILENPEEVRSLLEKHNFQVLHLTKDILIAKPRK